MALMSVKPTLFSFLCVAPFLAYLASPYIANQGLYLTLAAAGCYCSFSWTLQSGGSKLKMVAP